VSLNLAKQRFTITLIVLIVFFTRYGAYANSQSKTVQLATDWKAFMANHDLVWDRMPSRWECAPFLGNGLLGTMIYQGDVQNEVKFLISRSDIGRVDYPGGFMVPMRKILGNFILKTEGNIVEENSTMRLDLWNAEAYGFIKTTNGSLRWKSFIPSDELGVIVQVYADKGEENFQWIQRFNKDSLGTTSTLGKVNVFQVADTTHHPRSDLKSGGYAIAWSENKKDDGSRVFTFTIGASPVNRNFWKVKPDNFSADEEALLSLATLTANSLDSIQADHRAWWHNFFPRSFFSLSYLELESYYWIQLYKLGCTARSDMPMIDNHGVWSTEKAYGFATWDFNVQSTYRLYTTSNHLELGEPLIRFLDQSFNKVTMWNDRFQQFRAGMRQQTFLRYRFYDTDYWEHGKDLKADGPAKYLWGLHNYWRHYRFTKDQSMLKPLLFKLEGGINAFAAALKKRTDGTLFIPLGANWENYDRLEDPAGLYMVFQWALKTAIDIGQDLNYDTKKLSTWEYYLTHLNDIPVGLYPDGTSGIYLGKNQVPERYRHWSHLLAVFPFQMHTNYDDVKPTILENSVNYWSRMSTGLDGRNARAFAPVAALQLYSTLGEKEPIEDLIDIFMHRNSYRGPNVWPSTMYREYGPVVETPLFFADGLQSLVLQSWGDTIKVFPSIPNSISDVTFFQFRAEGNVLVSAQRTKGRTDFIKVTSLDGGDHILKTDIVRPQLVHSNSSILKIVDTGIFILSLMPGESAIVKAEEFHGKFKLGPVTHKQGHSNMFGLNKKFLKVRPFIQRYLDSSYSNSLWRDVE
jgi:alpha-L-fucosidase 2